MPIPGKKYRPKRGKKIPVHGDKGCREEITILSSTKDVVTYQRQTYSLSHLVTLADGREGYIHDIYWRKNMKELAG